MVKEALVCFLGTYESNGLSLSKLNMLENTTFLCIHMNDGAASSAFTPGKNSNL
jgi:hypothetical protein